MPLPEPLTQLYQKLWNITHLQPKAMTGSPPKNYDQNEHCAHHMDTSRHDTNCWALRFKIQDLIDNGMIAITPSTTLNIGTNPYPPTLQDHQNPLLSWFQLKSS